MHKVTLHNIGNTEIYRMNKDAEYTNSYTLKLGQVADSNTGQYTKASKKRNDNIRSNLHIDQYAGCVYLDHSQGQALVEPLALPRVTIHKQVSL